MTPDIFFWYLPTYATYANILAHVRNHVRQFYGNCRTLIINAPRSLGVGLRCICASMKGEFVIEQKK